MPGELRILLFGIELTLVAIVLALPLASNGPPLVVGGIGLLTFLYGMARSSRNAGEPGDAV